MIQVNFVGKDLESKIVDLSIAIDLFNNLMILLTKLGVDGFVQVLDTRKELAKVIAIILAKYQRKRQYNEPVVNISHRNALES